MTSSLNATDPNNPDIAVGDTLHGYTVTRIEELKDIASVYYECDHRETGARHIHISNKDKDNAFGVAFKTLPTDSTGVAHILEHTALCGSRQYPVRDPFFSMIKRSLNTFMNAFTASDWTMYPFSTQNKKDYYNLMAVYMDAAFFPNLDELSFKQEGHRLEIEEPDDPSGSRKLAYKGVVYNEMKGAMSTPREILVRSLLHSLYPSTTYRHNSGGDPGVIPTLTHEQLKTFHRRHYHPSNAYFYTYGNLPLRDHLQSISETVLTHFKAIDPQTDVPSQPRWKEPRVERAFYPLEKGEDRGKKCQVCVAWLTADIKDSFEILALDLLERILLGNSASPMRKALIDSGLGAALSDGSGFDADNRDTLFACGLKDVEESSAPEIERIIFDTLHALVEGGIDERLIDSAIHQIEFHRKEITHMPYPYGLKLLLSFSGSWLHGGDPVRSIDLDADFVTMREEIAKGSFFEDRIKRYFLHNPHRVLFTLVPDPVMAQRENDRVAEQLDGVVADLRDADMEKITRDTLALSELQDGEEDVSCLPTLAIADVPPDIARVEETTSFEAIPATCYEQPTSGIFYFCASIGAGLCQEELIPLVPLFCFALPRIGTALRDYAEMAQLMDTYTGGIGLSSQARTGFDNAGDCIPLVSFNGKCLVRNQKRMFDIIEELLCQYGFSDLSRLKTLLMEYGAGLESMVIPGGRRLAMSLASRSFSKTAALSERWSGIHQLKTIKALTEDLSDDTLERVSGMLATIGKTLFTQDNLEIALIGEDNALSSAVGPMRAIQNGLEGHTEGAGGSSPPAIDMDDGIPREGWYTSSAVSFVAASFATIRMGHEDAPVMSLIGRMLQSLFIHREVREKGGAYGGYAQYNSEDGIFGFASYRDPHIVGTLAAFKEAATFIRSGRYTDEDVKEAVLQVCSDIDRPDAPGHRASRAFYRKILSLTDETREQFKKQLLTTNRNRVLAVAEKYFSDVEEKQAVAVISGEEKLKSANERLTGNPLELFKI